MTDPRFWYLGLVPRTPTELAFARTEENDVLGSRVRAMVKGSCRDVPVAKDLSDLMEPELSDQKCKVI
jgi:hypothetical protein